MKTEDLLFAGALAAGAYFLFTGKTQAAAADTGGSNGGGYSSPPPNSHITTDTGQLVTHGDSKSSITASTPSDAPAANPDIVAGINYINSMTTTGAKLPTLSHTVQKLENNSNLAVLANGAKAVVTVKPAAVDSNGQTAMDRMIAKNKAASGQLHTI